ncbi:hypothetical protein D3C85_1419700 [compost metagenome]
MYYIHTQYGSARIIELRAHVNYWYSGNVYHVIEHHYVCCFVSAENAPQATGNDSDGVEL